MTLLYSLYNIDKLMISCHVHHLRLMGFLSKLFLTNVSWKSSITDGETVGFKYDQILFKIIARYIK